MHFNGHTYTNFFFLEKGEKQETLLSPHRKFACICVLLLLLLLLLFNYCLFLQEWASPVFKDSSKVLNPTRKKMLALKGWICPDCSLFIFDNMGSFVFCFCFFISIPSNMTNCSKSIFRQKTTAAHDQRLCFFILFPSSLLYL